MSARAWWAAAALAVVASATDAGAQSVAQRVDAVRDGIVRISFAPRPGICGDGTGNIWMRGRDESPYGYSRPCIVGPVRVRLGRADGQTVTVKTCVACRADRGGSPDVDLGDVPAAEAAKYLIDLARHGGGRFADEAVSAAYFADADVGPDLGRLVRDDAATLEARKQAIFWIGQGDGPTSDLVALYDALEPYALREHYTFVLSQRRDDAALSKLIDIARRDRDTHVRKQAMFWLGQSKDPKAVQFFKDILAR